MKIKPVRLVTKSIFRRSSQRDDYLVGLDGGGGGGCVGQMERKQALFFKYSIRAMLMIEMSLVQNLQLLDESKVSLTKKRQSRRSTQDDNDDADDEDLDDLFGEFLSKKNSNNFAKYLA
ncbi:1-phosphatidylinositol-4 5-bisphosphate phosphodiesterase epsilon-1 [Sarcoptes scabiei]|nr:1-phosphatidylinositol-4 5-bisphosphate phosphodiesterase epsilon-1 [Sarcoptes scabiei]